MSKTERLTTAPDQILYTAKKMANNIVQVQEIDGILAVDSRLVAPRLGIEHESFMKTVDNYQTQVEQAFGIIRFEIGKIDGRGRPPKYAFLTEDQATFLMSLSRNTPEVVQCKIDLVLSFSQAKKMIQQLEKPKTKLEMLLETVQQVVDLERKQVEQEERIQQTESKVSDLYRIQAQAIEELESFPAPSALAPEETADMKIRRLVNNYCRRTGSTQAECFRRLYQDDYYRNHRKIESQKKKSESVIQAYVRLGWIDSLYSLAIDLFAENKITAIDSRKLS